MRLANPFVIPEARQSEAEARLSGIQSWPHGHAARMWIDSYDPASQVADFARNNKKLRSFLSTPFAHPLFCVVSPLREPVPDRELGGRRRPPGMDSVPMSPRASRRAGVPRTGKPNAWAAGCGESARTTMTCTEWDAPRGGMENGV